MEQGFKPIDSDAKRGHVLLICDDQGTIARAWWHVDMWAYDMGDNESIHQVDFEPTGYKSLEKF